MTRPSTNIARIFAALLLAASACRDATAPNADPSPFPVVEIRLSTDSVRLATGAVAQVTALPVAADGRPRADQPVTWATANSAVATVASDGSIAAVGVGITIITARAAGRTATVGVTVVPTNVVAQLTVIPRVLSLGAGESDWATASASDANGRPVYTQPIRWRSSDTTVAIVDAAGRVAARAAGRARIIAEVDGREAALELTVTAGAAIPSIAGRWTMTGLGEHQLPTAYRVFLNENVNGRLVGRVEIRIDSATKTIAANGTYSRAYYFSEWHDGVRVLAYRWGDFGRYTLRRIETATVLTMTSDWFQNLGTVGTVGQGSLKLDETLWTGEAPEHTTWRPRP